MIQLIYAKKGSGKTKRLIDLANAELNSTKEMSFSSMMTSATCTMSRTRHASWT